MKKRNQQKPRNKLVVMRAGVNTDEGNPAGIGAPTRLTWPLVDLARATGMSVAFWKKIIAKGEIPATKGGNRTLILDEDLRAWLLKNRRVRGESEAA
jgi:hypothetical protein